MSAFSEVKVLTEINYRPASNTCDVAWVNKILKNGVVVSVSAPHRKSYGQDQKKEFDLEVEGGPAFSKTYGW